MIAFWKMIVQTNFSPKYNLFFITTELFKGQSSLRASLVFSLGHLGAKLFKVQQVLELVERGVVNVAVAAVAPHAEIGEAEAHAVLLIALEAVKQHVLVDVPAAVDFQALDREKRRITKVPKKATV
jgi:hypothetical protein